MQKSITRLSHRFCVAPMMNCSDRHDRFLLRLFSKKAFLYTEMVPIRALLNGKTECFLYHDPSESPVALQLGGSDPLEMARGAELGYNAGFDEININVGCPSSRVQAGRFGACLMKEPELVGQCFEKMQERVQIPITIKCRIGVDSHDKFEDLYRFVQCLSSVGCQTFVIHARKAWLRGLSPKQNREIPPLDYESVYRLKREFDQLEIIVNGGICSLDETFNHLISTDGVMVGREAYRNPSILRSVDRKLFGAEAPDTSILDVLELYKIYIEKELNLGTSLHQMTRHLFGLFHGAPGARGWRRHLASKASSLEAGIEVVLEAERHVEKFLSQSEEMHLGSVDKGNNTGMGATAQGI